MAKSKDKKKKLSSAQRHEAGLVDFTMDDVRNARNAQNSANAKAYELMVDAMAVSANYATDTINDEGNVAMDDVYPTSLDETLRMDELLDQSERAVQDENDEDYNRMIVDLRGIVGWSRRRHFNFSWMVILGVIITVVAVMYWSNSDDKSKRQAQKELETIEAWDVNDDANINWAQVKDEAGWTTMYSSAAHYKAFTIKNCENSILSSLEIAKENRAYADTCTSIDRQKSLLKGAKSSEEYAAETAKKLEKVKAWSLKDAQEEAIKEKKSRVQTATKAAAFSYVIMIFFLLLIPAYIIANYAWGYNITKYREESALLNKIQKWGVALGGGMIGAAAAMEYLPDTKVTTHYSDGSSESHTESNGGNMIIAGIKLCLLVIGLAIIAIVSTVIMIYSTIQGFRRNYNWGAIAAPAKASK